MDYDLENRKWVYVAAPYTVPDPVVNTHNAIMAAERLLEIGYFPVIPHLTLAWHMVTPHCSQFWYDYTMELLKRCDFMVRLPGYSVGCDKEEEMASKLGIPVFYGVESLKVWKDKGDDYE